MSGASAPSHWSDDRSWNEALDAVESSRRVEGCTSRDFYWGRGCAGAAFSFAEASADKKHRFLRKWDAEEVADGVFNPCQSVVFFRFDGWGPPFPCPRYQRPQIELAMRLEAAAKVGRPS